MFGWNRHVLEGGKHRAEVAGFVERLRQPREELDGLPVVVEDHRDGHVGLRPANAELYTIDEPIQRMRGIEFA